KRIEKRSGKPEGAAKDIPGSIHLSRRTDYLINVLREEHRKPGILDVLSGRTVETPVKEPKGRARVSNSKSSSKRTTNGDVEPSHDKRRLSGELADDSVRKPKKATPGKDSSKSNAQNKP